MPVRVRFRMNKRTGEVEEFLVDDQDRQLSEAAHDRIAGEVARFVAVRPRITEVPGDEAAAAAVETPEQSPAEAARRRTSE